jgi:photosystem II stability/assembly factor-like uncharacterized protein
VTILLLITGLLSAAPGQFRTLERNGAVIERVPIVGSPRPILAGEPSACGPALTDSGFVWRLVGNFPNAVFIDLSFADDSVGYACAELGVLYKSTNSGENWTRIMNLGFPYYWYGVHALSRQKVIVTGFNNTSGAGIYRWSTDGGASWDSIVALDTANWFSTVQFADSLHGIIVAGWNGAIWRTENGGRNPEDWSYVQLDPERGWFAGNFPFLPDLHSYLTGITFCHSRDAGVNWDVRHSIDAVFDGGVWFPDTVCGWTGGGQISEPVKGWVHRTTDAGATWSDRLIETPEPIRSVLFLNDTLGFIVGGNLYSGVGAIYSTVNGGDSWRLDTNTHAEMKGIDAQPAGPDSIDIWCVGFNNSFTGFIYKTRLGTGTSGFAESRPARLPARLEAFPNPARDRLAVLAGPDSKQSRLRLFNAAGRQVREWSAGSSRLELTGIAPGWYRLVCGQAATTVLKAP